MKRKLLRVVAGVMTLMMVLTSVGGVVPAYAGDGQKTSKEATKQERVLTVTQAMVGINGKLIITGEWDRIIVPKEIDASRISFEDVKVGSIEIESGNKSKIEMVSGDIGAVEVVPAKTTEMSVKELVELIRNSGDSNAAFRMYQELNDQNQRYKNSRPTLITHKDAKVSEVSVSGNVKLNLTGGNVEQVKVDVGKSDTALKVEIANYTGEVSVKQKDREDGKRAVANVTLKNTTVEKLVLEGEQKGNIILDGQNSEVKEAKVENAPEVTINVKTEKLEVGKEAAETKITVLAKVEEMKVEANNAKVEVGSSGTVTSAKVEGNNVNIGGAGKLDDVKIEGTGASVSTSGTKVEGENTYVPPVVVTPPSDPVTPPVAEGVRDLGGLQIIIGDHWTPTEPMEPSNAEEEALLKYREEMMKKHNFTIKQMKVADWGDMVDAYQSSISLGSPVAQVFFLDYRFVAGNRHLFYDLSTLSELDFTEDKWMDSVTEQMTYGDGIYGMAAGENEPRSGVFFNKRLFKEAGLDPNLPYDLQKSGEWTWSKYMELCKLLTRDTNGDGTTDVYAQGSQDVELITQLVMSMGTDFVTVENGKYVNKLDSEEVKNALEFSKELINSEYSMPQPEGSSWDWFVPAFASGMVAMQFNQEYMAQSYQTYGQMDDEIGFVCCPKPDGADSYHTMFYDNVAVIPACYDAQTAADIAFAYDLWTNPAPGYENAGDDWKKVYETHNLDERAINETLEIFRQEGVGVTQYISVIEDTSYFAQDLMWEWPYDNRTVEEVVAELMPEWDAVIAEANEIKKLDVVAPRPDGSNLGILDLPYSISVKDDSSIAITGYRDRSMEELVIPAELYGRKVTEIASHAFNYCTELKSVVLPEGLLKIGEYAFSSCESMTEIVIPESVTEIGRYAFAYCNELKRANVPSSVTSIGENAFVWPGAGFALVVDTDSYAESYAKENKIAIMYSDGTEPTVVFSYENLEDGTVRITGTEGESYSRIVIPAEIDGKAVTEIGASAFNNTNITSVVLPEGLLRICPNAFSWCRNLTEIVIPDSVTEILNGAFTFTGLKKVEIPKNVSVLGSDVFYQCNSMSYIGVAEDNPYFTSVDGVVYSKDKIRLVTAPAGLMTERYEMCAETEEVCYNAFRGCYGIQTIVIPSKVEVINRGAFEINDSLCAIEVAKDNPYFCSVDGVLFSKDMKELIRVPEQKEGTAYVVPDGVEIIEDKAFFWSGFTKVVIPEGVKNIGVSAFFASKNLTTVSLPESLVRIYGQVFGGCTKLENVILPSNLGEINGQVFVNCESLTKLTIPDSVTMVDLTAFSGCKNLTEVVIPESVEWMINVPEGSPLLVLKVVKGSYADNYATEKNLPVTYIGEEEKTDEFLYTETAGGTIEITGYVTLASGKVSVPEMIDGKKVTAVTGGAFAGCTTMTEVEIPNTVTEIGERAFDSCTGLVWAVIPESVVMIAEDAFKNCNNPNFIIATSPGSYVDDYAKKHGFVVNYYN